MELLTKLLLICGLAFAPAPKTRVIINDPGGYIMEYVAKYALWAHNGDQIRIEGQCDSACTVLLGIIPDERVCATKNAELGFHSGGLGTEYSQEATILLWSFYQERTRRVLVKRGWRGPTKHPELIYVEAQEIVRPCR